MQTSTDTKSPEKTSKSSRRVKKPTVSSNPHLCGECAFYKTPKCKYFNTVWGGLQQDPTRRNCEEYYSFKARVNQFYRDREEMARWATAEREGKAVLALRGRLHG